MNLKKKLDFCCAIINGNSRDVPGGRRLRSTGTSLLPLRGVGTYLFHAISPPLHSPFSPGRNPGLDDKIFRKGPCVESLLIDLLLSVSFYFRQ